MSTLDEKFERLVAAGIELLPLTQFPSHFVFTRGGFVSLVERRGRDFGQIGGAGLLVERGFAPLIWRDGEGYFVFKGVEEPATPEQIAQIRQFSSDLRAALE